MINVRRTVLTATALVAVMVVMPGFCYAYQMTQTIQQAEARNPAGQITVEASVIHVIQCNSAGENGGNFYIYQYTKRPGFRAILPPNWGNAIGGRDFPTFQEAATAACGAGNAQGGQGRITVTNATYGGNCRAPQGNQTQNLATACNGRQTCSYTIDYGVIGDPAGGCAKDYTAQWQCNNGTAARSTRAEPEAGFKKVITLSCQ